jgi:cell division initiation protein
MSLTPQDIQTQQFHVRLRGFDVEEVDAFLEKVAEEFLVLQEENKQFEKRVEEMTRDLSSYRAQEKSFQNAILAAQNIVDQMKEKSRQESDDLVANATKEAKRLKDEARQEVMALEKEIERLNGLKTEAQQSVRDLLHSYLEKVEKGPVKPPATVAVSSSFSSAPPAAAGVAVTAASNDSNPDSPPPSEKAGGEEFAGLYEQIDLSDNDMPLNDLEENDDDSLSDDDILMMSEDEEGLAEDRIFSFADDAAEKSRIPEMEGDIAFSLEDPEEESEPRVSFGDDSGPKKRPSR